MKGGDENMEHRFYRHIEPTYGEQRRQDRRDPQISGHCGPSRDRRFGLGRDRQGSHDRSPHRGDRRGWQTRRPEQQALHSTAVEIARLFAVAGRSSIGHSEKQAELRSIVERTRKDLSEIIDEPTQGTSESTTAETEQA